MKTLEWLLEIDRAVEAAHGKTGAWLLRRSRSASMNGRTPIEAKMEGGEPAITGILQQLNREVMRKALRQLPGARP